MRRVCLIFIAFACSACGFASGPTTVRVVAPPVTVSQVTAGIAMQSASLGHVKLGPAAVSVRTLQYCPRNGFVPRMDLFTPNVPNETHPSAVLFVHGGAWVKGTRKQGILLESLKPALLARGIAVAAIDYRLAPSHPWPSQIEDVRCAVRFLRENGARLGLNTERIGAWGESAGGHLVTQLATDHTQNEVGRYLDRSSAVQAVLDVAGPMDLNARDWPAEMQLYIRQVFGSAPDTLRDAGALGAITPDDPPFLVIHGDADTLVPIAQSRMLAQHLRAAHVPVTLTVLHGANHIFTPSPQLIAQAADFFAAKLAG